MKNTGEKYVCNVSENIFGFRLKIFQFKQQREKKKVSSERCIETENSKKHFFCF